MPSTNSRCIVEDRKPIIAVLQQDMQNALLGPEKGTLLRVCLTKGKGETLRERVSHLFYILSLGVNDINT